MYKLDNIKIILGDITMANVDCIVNAANNSLLGGGGVDGAIHAAAGDELFNECLLLGGCETGQAKITKGYNLPAKYIIHTVGPIYDNNENDAILLSNCYKNTLSLAKEHNIHSIAFPCISTGIYGYPIEDATKIAFKTILNWLTDNKTYNIDIYLYCFLESDYNVYTNYMNTLK